MLTELMCRADISHIPNRVKFIPLHWEIEMRENLNRLL